MRSKVQQLPQNEVNQTPEPVLEANTFVDKGRILQARRLKEGKRVMVIPFTAGVDIEANEELDKISLMIVKGVADAFNQDQKEFENHFTVLTNESPQQPDFLIQGHIIKKKDSSHITKWTMLGQREILGVKGRLVDARTLEPILVFEDQAAAKSGGDSYNSLGHDIGKSIGQFILSGLQD